LTSGGERLDEAAATALTTGAGADGCSSWYAPP
jgi:hypothetical protein